MISTLLRRRMLAGSAASLALLAAGRGSRAQVISGGGGLSPSQVRVIPKNQSLMRSWYPNANLRSLAPAQINTISSQWLLESDFDLVRLVFNNPSITAGYAIPKIIIAASTALGDGHSPVNASAVNDVTMFQIAYFNNAGLDVLPQDQTLFGSGTIAGAVPINPGTIARPPFFFSDWMRITSLPRTDGGTLPILIVHSLTDNLGTLQTANMPLSAVWNPLAQGRTLHAYFKGGVDAVTTPALLVSPAETVDLFPLGVEYMTRNPGFTVCLTGDSLTKGQGSTSANTPWGFLSCLALSTPAQPISCWNQAWTGQLSSDYWFNGYNGVKASKPNAVTIPVWSPNDGLTQATADTGWSRAMDFADYVMRQGAIPVLMGPCPWSGISTGPQETARLSIRTRMLNAGAQGVPFLDWEAVIGTGASPNRIQAGLIAVDNQHPNDTGNALMDSAVFRPVLAGILRA